MASDVTLEFENQLYDHLRADRLYYSRAGLSKVDKVVAIGLALFGVGVTAFSGFRWYYPLFFLLAVLEWFNLLSPRPLQMRIGFKKNPKFRERYQLTFNQEGIHFQTSTIDSKLAWSHYSRFMEDDRLFLLIYGKQMYTVIPKSAFNDSEAISLLRDLISSKISAA